MMHLHSQPALSVERSFFLKGSTGAPQGYERRDAQGLHSMSLLATAAKVTNPPRGRQPGVRACQLGRTRTVKQCVASRLLLSLMQELRIACKDPCEPKPEMECVRMIDRSAFLEVYPSSDLWH